MRIRLRVLLSALAGTVLVAGDAIAQQHAPEPAGLGVRVCNQTGGEIEVAKALNSGATDGKSRIIISEGWYKFAGGTCAFLWTGKLAYRYYLLYAQNKVSKREWAGKIPICVSRQPFTIRSDTCGPEHYRRMFFQIDTGKEENLFTYTFR